jgi:hypothetical protein
MCELMSEGPICGMVEPLQHLGKLVRTYLVF